MTESIHFKAGAMQHYDLAALCRDGSLIPVPPPEPNPRALRATVTSVDRDTGTVTVDVDVDVDGPKYHAAARMRLSDLKKLQRSQVALSVGGGGLSRELHCLLAWVSVAWSYS